MELLEQLRISSGASSVNKRNGHYIQLSYESLRARHQGQQILQRAGWAAYPLNTKKSYSLEIYVTEDKVALEVEPKRAAGEPKDILIRHINSITPQLKASVEDTSTVELCTDGKFHIVPGDKWFYEICKTTQNKLCIKVMAGPLGTHRIDLGYDVEELKAEIKHLREYEYLNINGVWSETWMDEDGNKAARLEGVEVEFKLREGKRHGEKFTVDGSEYFSTVEQLIAEGYRRGIGKKKSGEEVEDTWLLSDKMNVR